MSSRTLLHNLSLFYYGVVNHYPLCCVLAFIKSSDYYGFTMYDEQRRKGLTPLWAGTGYVPCARCTKDWVIPHVS